MALLFLDSFDHYTNAEDKYTATHTASIVAGRHNKGFQGQGQLGLNPAPTSSRCIMGAAWYVTFLSDNFFAVYDKSHGVVTCYVAADGAVEVAVGSASARSAADVIKTGQWYFLELDVTIAYTPEWQYSAAICKFYVDGELVIDVVDLGPTIAALAPPEVVGWNRVLHGAFGNNSTIDDFYVLDGSGPAPHNAPLGDVQIDVIRPNGVGASTQWTPVGAATNFGCVADQVPDDESTKVIAATAGLADLYQLEDINTNEGIIGAQLLINARRTEEGFAQLTPLLRHAGTTTALPTRTLSPTFFYRNRDCFVTMPNGDPLTDANVAALQAGFRREA